MGDTRQVAGDHELGEEDEKFSQGSSVNASTIAGERETESSMADDLSTAAGQLSQDESESMDVGDAFEQADHMADNLESNSAFSSSQDTNLVDDEKGNKEAEAEKCGESDRMVSPPAPKTTLVAITKKDVAKQFHSLMMAEAADSVVKQQSAAESSSAVTSKESLEVMCEEPPDDLLTASPKRSEEKVEEEMLEDDSAGVVEERKEPGEDAKVVAEREEMKTDCDSEAKEVESGGEIEGEAAMESDKVEKPENSGEASTNFDFSQVRPQC